MKVETRRPALGRVFASFHSYNFRVFWFGQLISQIGTWMQIVALPWLVLEMTHSAVALGTVTALQFVPILCVVLFAGVIVDRFPKHRLLLVTQSAALAQALTLAALTASGRIQVWHLYALALVIGFVNAFDQPARQALVTEMVGRENVVNAVGLSSAQFSAARMVGPALGGLVIAHFGSATCFFLNAASFLAVIFSLLALRPGEFHSVPKRTVRGNMLRDLGEGLRFLLTTPRMTVAIIILAGNGAFIYSTSSIIPLIAEYGLHVGASEFGLLVASVGFGSVMMALTMASHGRSSQRLMISSAIAFAALYFALAFVPNFGVAFVLLAFVGAAIQAFGTSVNSLLQLGSPDHLRGRSMAVFTLLTNGIIPLGALFSGFVTAAAGIRFTVAGEACICFVALGGAAVYRARVKTAAALAYS
ncbi:MAG TPA: MFS transporter [Chloroflexota bacterium]|nr:MFS transporter [Chloroflexota bacterium]